MLDKNTEEILKNITVAAPNGYKLFTVDDFLTENVEEGINKLAEDGYILVKYNCDGEYLLALTQSGKDYFALKYEKLIYKSLISKRVALFAFIGSFLGCLTFLLVLILVGWTNA